MKANSKSAALTGLLASLIVSSTPLLAKKAPKGVNPSVATVSTPFQKAMGLAEAASGQSEFNARLKDAAAVANSADENYFVGAVRYKRALANNNRQELVKGADEMVSSGSSLVPNRGDLAFSSGLMAFELGDYNGAAIRMARADQYGSKDINRFLVAAESHARIKRYDEAMTAFAKAAAEQKPQESWYHRAIAIGRAGKLSNDVGKWGAALAQDYPTPENWRSAIMNFRDSAKHDNATMLDIARLVRDAKVLAGERDHAEHATQFNSLGAPGEAKAVVESGYASQVLPKTNTAAKTALTAATTKSAAERKLATGEETKASASADGKLALSAANRWLGLGENTRAAGLYQMALKKGNVDTDLANLRLGIALSRSGNKAEATTAFGAVGAGKAGIAALWSAFVAR